MGKEEVILGPILKQLELYQNGRVRNKAYEFMRLLDLRAKGGIQGGGRGVETSKYIVCIHLACRANNTAFDRRKAVALVGTTLQAYALAASAVSSILQQRMDVNLAEIGAEFDHEDLVEFAETVFNKYKENFLAGLAKHRHEHVDFSKPCNLAAAFFLSTQWRKVEIDKKRLLEFTDTTPADFQRACESIQELTFGAHTAPPPSAHQEVAQKRAESAFDRKKASVGPLTVENELKGGAATKKRPAPEGRSPAPEAKRQKLTDQEGDTQEEVKEKEDESGLGKSYLNEELDSEAVDYDPAFAAILAKYKANDPAEKQRKKDEADQAQFLAWKEKVLAKKIPTATKQTTLGFGEAKRQEEKKVGTTEEKKVERQEEKKVGTTQDKKVETTQDNKAQSSDEGDSPPQ